MAAVAAAIAARGNCVTSRTAWSLSTPEQESAYSTTLGERVASHTWTKSQKSTPVKAPSPRRDFGDGRDYYPPPSQCGSNHMPGLLAQMESDYAEIKRVDAELQDHLGQWLRHMEQWMYVQQNVYARLQEHCEMMDFDTESLVEAPLTPHTSAAMVTSSALKADKGSLRNMEAPRLPAAVEMIEPEQDKTPLLHRQIPERSQAPSAAHLSTPPPMSRGDEHCKFLREPPSKPAEVSSNGLQPHPHDVSPKGVLLEELPAPLPENMEVDRVTLLERESSSNNDSDGRATVVTRATVVPNAAMIRSALSQGEFEALPKEHKMWVDVVQTILATAKKKRYYELREQWKKEDEFMKKFLRTNNNLDLKVLVRPKPKAGRTSMHKALPGMAGMHVPDFNPITHFGFSQTGHTMDKQVTSTSTRKSVSHIVNTPSVASEGSSKIILDPQSRTRLTWMAAGMIFMLYDLIVLPMQAFEIPRHWFTDGMQWVGQIFWTLDIAVTFITAVYVKTELITDLRIIAKNYVKTWLVFDVAVVAPLWVVQIAAASDENEESSGPSANAGFFRFIRMMRFLRLARIAKFEHYLQEALAAVNSSSIMLLVGIFKLMTCMILVSHINACLWYWVGTAQGGWASPTGDYYESSWFYQYLTSMHWAFTQFQGTSDILPGSGGSWVVGERAYAVVIVMGALIILSSFVGSLTNRMMQLQHLREQRQGMERNVREFLSANDISKGLSVRVKKYIDWKQRMANKLGKFDEVLKDLPLALQIDLQEEVKGPMVVSHRFFCCLRAVHSRIFRLMCHESMMPLFPAPGELIFSPQVDATKMYFCVCGMSRYMENQNQNKSGLRSAVKIEDIHEQMRRNSGINSRVLSRSKSLNEEEDEEEDGVVVLTAGNYLVEPVLWTIWEHCGFLMSVSDAQYYTLDVASFEKIVVNTPAHVSVILYARRFVAGLNRFGRKFNDIIDITTFEEEEDSDDEESMKPSIDRADSQIF